MHDPNTVAIEIFGPRGLYYKWLRDKSDKVGLIPYVEPLVVIWHVDPEKNGHDDSCGFTYPPVTKEDEAWLRKEASADVDFLGGGVNSASTVEVIFSIWSVIAWRKYRHGKLSAQEIQCIFKLAASSSYNLAYMVDQVRAGSESLYFLFRCVFMTYSQLHRPWWKHPRWHIHHWRVQIPILLYFKRFLFSRCHGCGKRFKWKESPTSFSWNGKGPRWFRSEPNIYHSACASEACRVAREEGQ